MHGWACDRCETLHSKNARQCRSCGHDILRPASEEEFGASNSSVAAPEASTPGTVGTTPDLEGDKSPDVAADGSLKRDDESGRGGIFTRLKQLFS